MENLQNVFNVEATVLEAINVKLEEVSIELSEEQKKEVADILISNQILTVDKIIDLDDFVHVTIEEGQDVPVKSLLVNHLLVYLYEGTRTIRAHEEDYNEYLEDNELYSDEYGYDEFLLDNELVETFPSEEFSYARYVEIGGIYLNALKAKEVAQKQLEESAEVIAKVEPLISDHFIKIVE